MFRQPIECDGICRSFVTPKFLELGATFLDTSAFEMDLRGVIRTQENIVMHSLCITYQIHGSFLQVGGFVAMAVMLDVDTPFLNSLPQGFQPQGSSEVVGRPGILYYKEIDTVATATENFSITGSVVLPMRQGLLQSGTPISMYIGVDGEFSGFCGVTLSYNSEKELSR